MYEKSISLDPRLKCIAEMVGKCDCYADIGCDHGRLGAFLLQHHWVQQAILSDISDQSLQKARALVRLVGVETDTCFAVCDGLDGIDRNVNAIVIAGMGGETIADILERGSERIGDARLILQANVAIPELRMRLCRMGFRITDERLVRDGRRFYVILQAERGTSECSFEELIVGPVLIQMRPDGFKDYAAYRLRIARKAYEGAIHGNGDVSQLNRELHVWEECLNGERS